MHVYLFKLVRVYLILYYLIPRCSINIYFFTGQRQLLFHFAITSLGFVRTSGSGELRKEQVSNYSTHEALVINRNIT